MSLWDEIRFALYYNNWRWLLPRIIFWTLFIVIVVVLIWMLADTPVYAEEVDINIIIQIESSGNPNAMGKAGEIGLMQISSSVLREWNSRVGTKYNAGDLYTPTINVRIGSWYFNKRAVQYLKYYKFEDTIENRIRVYNWGIGKMIKHRDNLEKKTPNKTRRYIKKYYRLLNKR